MKTQHLPKALAAGLCIASLGLGGCANLTPGENAAIAGTATGLAVGLPLALTGVNPAVTIPVTAGAAVLAGGGTYLLAKKQATTRQRQVAADRAAVYAGRTGTSSRYLAVRTESGRDTRGKAQVMIYDTVSDSIVGNMVYDLSQVPPVGEMGNFGGYRARYIGTGS